MTLKDIAKKIVQVGQLVPGYGPIFTALTALTPTKADDVIVAKIMDSSAKIADLVLVAQSFGEALNLQGAQKLDGIVGSVAQIVQQSAPLINTEVVDTAEFAAGCREIASGWSRVLKSVKKKE